MAVNRKKILLPTEMARAGWAVLDGRDDLEPVPFGPELSTETFHEMLATAAGVSKAAVVRFGARLGYGQRLQPIVAGAVAADGAHGIRNAYHREAPGPR